jgi:hypothetical protein
MSPERRKYRNGPKHGNTGKRAQMLNVHKINGFRFDLKEMLKSSKTDDKYIASFMAMLVAKASRQSIDEAKDYVEEKETDGTISRELGTAVMNLLDRYTKYR